MPVSGPRHADEAVASVDQQGAAAAAVTSRSVDERQRAVQARVQS